MTVLVQKAILNPNLSCLLNFQIKSHCKTYYCIRSSKIWCFYLFFSSNRMALVASKSQQLHTEKYINKISSMTMQVSVSKKDE